MILNLDGQLTSWTQDQSTHSLRLLLVSPIFLNSLYHHIKYGYAKSECLSLARLGCNDHINVGLEVDQTLGLHYGGVLKLIDHQRFTQ